GPPDTSPHLEPPDGLSRRPELRRTSPTGCRSLGEARDALTEPDESEHGDRPRERRSCGRAKARAPPEGAQERDGRENERELTEPDAEVEGDETRGEGRAWQPEVLKSTGETESVDQTEAEGEPPAPPDGLVDATGGVRARTERPEVLHGDGDDAGG